MSGFNDLDQIRGVHNTGFNVDNLKQERNVMLSNTEITECGSMDKKACI